MNPIDTLHPPPLSLLVASLAAWAALPLASAAPAPAGAPRHSNLIFIMADDLGYGDLGCYGGRMIHTPNLDRLAREGTRFTSCYAGAPVCAPSRCVLMTGLHNGHCLVRDNSPQVGGKLESFGEGNMRLSLTGNETTVATVLRAAGYATGAAGKWGLGEPESNGTPWHLGFDEWLGYLNQNHAPYYYSDYLWGTGAKRPVPENAGGQRRVYSNDLFRDFALDFVRRHRDQPFFLYLPMTIPHNRMEVPSVGEYAALDWPEDAKIYAAMVTRLDGYVGELIAELHRLHLAEDTLVLFTSDNGALHGARADWLHSNDDFRGAKSTLYEGGLRMPMVAWWPGHVPAGRVNDAIWWFADVLPTFAALAGAKAPAGLDGMDISSVLLGRSATLPDRRLYWEFPRDRLGQAARHGRWKGVRVGTDQPMELYDLTTDPGETHNVAASHPEVIRDLELFLAAGHTPSPNWPVD